MIVKVCGITRVEDALHAVRNGASALGFVFWPGSPRHIAPRCARRITDELPDGIETVGVFVNQDAAEIRDSAALAGIRTIQLHGDESPGFAAALNLPVWRALPVHARLDVWAAEITILLDACDRERRGGTGRQVDWGAAAAAAARRRVVLAGGLNPGNVARAITAVRPFGVDVSSGVETAPGIKDPERVARFLAAAQAGLHASRG
ncbi:MAG TPA: phosphoribosylanthranilate isomerase [Longimicrobiales bacterium]|nr:phosphoribosylanthranilate isomerase [Longimicrobiales bacterium]